MLHNVQHVGCMAPFDRLRGNFMCSWHCCLRIALHSLQAKISAANLKLSNRATLALTGRRIELRGLDLDGTLIAEVGPHATLKLEKAIIENRGWAWQQIKDGPGKRPPSEEEAMRCVFPRMHLAFGSIHTQGCLVQVVTIVIG